MNIRPALLKDAQPIRNLVLSLARYYLVDEATELPDWFVDTLNLASFEDRLLSPEFKNYVLEEHSRLVGYVSIRNDEHIYHLFVSEDYQGQGFSRQLWEYARKQSRAEKFWLRSSLHAVPIYKRFGFTESGDVGVRDGISFQPMHLEHQCEPA